MIDEIVFEKIKYGLKMRLSEDFVSELASIPDVDIAHCLDPIYDSIVVQLRGFIWGRQIDRISIKYPADWRQAIKEQFCPAWMLRRWPVVYKTEIIDVKALYPTIPDVPGHSRTISVCHNAHLETKENG